jgi:hypothetical protein
LEWNLPKYSYDSTPRADRAEIMEKKAKRCFKRKHAKVHEEHHHRGFLFEMGSVFSRMLHFLDFREIIIFHREWMREYVLDRWTDYEK